MVNPFITSGYACPEYFCDRFQETQDIINLLQNGNNLALISPRRIGKTDLLRHCIRCFCQKARSCLSQFRKLCSQGSTGQGSCIARQGLLSGLRQNPCHLAQPAI